MSIVTTTSDKYASCFGFTEDEVFDALTAFGLDNKKEDVKQWYDGFTFGSMKDIYNPWSITNNLDHKLLSPYWASTSSNSLVNNLLQSASGEMKSMMETLLDGGSINVNIKIRELLEFQKLLFYVTKMELDVYIKVNGPFTKEYN